MILSLLTLACYIAVALAASRTSPPSGAVVVRQSGTQAGEFSTISAAIASIGSTTGKTIFIYGGSYKEQVTISTPNTTILGYTTNTASYGNNVVTITNNLNSQDAGSNEASATLRLVSKANYLKVYNINVANTYGTGRQAVAVAARGSYLGFYGVKFTGNQDTLFADAGSPGYQYYSNSYILGNVDYIFGHASAWFGECTIASNAGGAITANSRETTSDPSYYVFDHSKVVSAASSSITDKVYLGRPWRVLARVVFQNSDLSDIINPAGYTTMAEGATPVYSEYGNSGARASTSSRKFYTPISAAITKSQVLGSAWQSWTDTSY